MPQKLGFTQASISDVVVCFNLETVVVGCDAQPVIAKLVIVTSTPDLGVTTT